MSDSNSQMGKIGWVDLTIPNADEAREFYSQVIGWESEGLDMGGYSDYVMKSADGQGTAGVCHKRGGNADLPSCWLIYVNVPDLDRSLQQCRDLGGEVLSPVRSYGGQGRYCIISDPSGAALALFEPA